MADQSADLAMLTPADEAAICEAVNGRIPESYGTRAEYVCAIAGGIIVRIVGERLNPPASTMPKKSHNV